VYRPVKDKPVEAPAGSRVTCGFEVGLDVVRNGPSLLKPRYGKSVSRAGLLRFHVLLKWLGGAHWSEFTYSVHQSVGAVSGEF